MADRQEIDVEAWREQWRDLTQSMVFDGVWAREGLSSRERRLLTIGLVVSGQSEGAAKHHLRAALDEGIDTDDLFETILHTAIYAGWPKGGFAMQVCAELAAERRALSNREGGW
ncbi:carboxymuconolactone decarboxylase family protein [Egibacter rhizosphaerae]|uniref:Carboxymuconolactone decarboxylase family protein n=1 Tax=Egibacter rhizosphaerae TaxID=1670831 RepID=A0A411YH24_9ACTN|nr:carboxymuconolactone decarboxylase family protein [Egibacter rhizosphaerae]QBI20540.1 carboxymuconolactone decarboxylase family protein [Egibacter rhizosphaerae]